MEDNSLLRETVSLKSKEIDKLKERNVLLETLFDRLYNAIMVIDY